MAQEKRSSVSKSDAGPSIGTGPFLARIVSHLDPTFMGSLEVTLLRDQGNTVGDGNQTYIVSCAVPFFGYTAFEHMGQNSTLNKKTQGEQALNQRASGPTSSTQEAFNDTQKSYGMWMVPPDVGVTVLVIFVDGDPSQGFWIACVPARFSNNMVPAIAGSTEVDMDNADKQKYNTKLPLPVAEINKRVNAKDQKVDADKIKKALHPIAEAFLRQGLVEDDVRGVTTSSARREAPSMVFGISTPGPLDRRLNAKKALVGKVEDKTQQPVPVSRLGGTQFVMDDGDDRYRRATPAATGPVKYIDMVNGKYVGSDEKTNDKGDPTIPYNEYFRIRTRTGHQLLMHNSEDLIYIGNAAGTTWIEMTSNGKIDIFAQDSVSIHTETDFNFFANRDVNIEANRNINIKAGGRGQIEIGQDFNQIVGTDAKITVGANYDLRIGGTTKIASAQDLNVVTSGNAKYTSSGNTHVAVAGNYFESAAKIHMNGPLADVADVAVQVVPLSTHANPSVNTSAGWSAAKYQQGTVSSIMKRVPMHEPWALHENQAPHLLTPTNTDRDS